MVKVSQFSRNFPADSLFEIFQLRHDSSLSQQAASIHWSDEQTEFLNQFLQWVFANRSVVVELRGAGFVAGLMIGKARREQLASQSSTRLKDGELIRSGRSVLQAIRGHQPSRATTNYSNSRAPHVAIIADRTLRQDEGHCRSVEEIAEDDFLCEWDGECGTGANSSIQQGS
jgi:hypothetical protein